MLLTTIDLILISPTRPWARVRRGVRGESGERERASARATSQGTVLRVRADWSTERRRQRKVSAVVARRDARTHITRPAERIFSHSGDRAAVEGIGESHAGGARERERGRERAHRHR